MSQLDNPDHLASITREKSNSTASDDSNNTALSIDSTSSVSLKGVESYVHLVVAQSSEDESDGGSGRKFSNSDHPTTQVASALDHKHHDQSHHVHFSESSSSAPSNEIERGERLLTNISKMSTTKQKPHSDINHTQVVVCTDSILSQLQADVSVIIDNDPAFDSYLELILYPGLWAILTYRLAHCIYYLLYSPDLVKGSWTFFSCKVLQFIAKLMCILTRSFTGIEIHPGANIGKGFFIDHGSGVVIGETAIVGNYCTLYQGVTLGGTGKESGKRHPTLGDNVLVGSGAKVLGNIVIGSNVKIGAGSVVVKDAPSDCTLVGVPARCLKDKTPTQPNGSMENVPSQSQSPPVAEKSTDDAVTNGNITEEKPASNNHPRKLLYSLHKQF